MSQDLEEKEHSNEETFKERIKKDYEIIRDNMKTRVVWRYYLFWLLKGLEPSFFGLSYYFIKQECEITQVEYGVINIIGSSTLLSGVLIY